MEVAIFSGGPHLERNIRYPSIPYGKTIAVNDAINRIEDAPDWYCAGDPIAYTPEFTTRRPREGWLISSNIFAAEVKHWGGIPHLCWPDLPLLVDVPHLSHSIAAAYALAIHLGATHIVTFGEDRTDEGTRYDHHRRAIEEMTIAEILRRHPVPVERVTCS